jgi:hypothetical protein
MDRTVVHDVHMVINLVHRLVYFVPEAAEEYAAFGVNGAGGYFASRAAPMGAVADEVVVRTFYNFSPRAVASAMPGVWEAASPEAWQQARFRVVRRALDRVGVELPSELITEARSLVDPVVAGLDHVDMPLAAANAAVALPDDPLVALWQQVTVLREWRGDAHIDVLVANGLGPCECLVLQVGTGRFPMRLARATRRWDDTEWAAAVASLAARGWAGVDGAITAVGTEERERLEAETDQRCAPMWQPVGDRGATRLGELIVPIHKAVDAAGTYAAFA